MQESMHVYYEKATFNSFYVAKDSIVKPETILLTKDKFNFAIELISHTEHI